MDASEAGLVKDLVEQNKKLMARIIELQTKKKRSSSESDEAEAEAEQIAPKKSRRTTHPRVKPKKLRRSPRNHSPAATPSPKPQVSAAMRRRLSYTTSCEKRNTPTKERQLVRQTLGAAIKIDLDEMLLAQHFRDENRFFKLDEFRHHAMPIVEALQADESINTSMYTKNELFKLAVNIAKKRDFYVPQKKKKLSPTKKRKLRAQKLQKKAKQVRAAAAAAAAAASGELQDKANPNPAAAATPAVGPGSDDDATEVAAAAAAATGATEEPKDPDDDDDILDLIQLNAEEQKKRKK